MLRKRVLTSLIGLPIFIAAIWLGGAWFFIMVVFIAIIGSIEFHKICNNGNLLSISYFSIFIAVLLVITPIIGTANLTIHLIAVALVTSVVWVLFISPKDKATSIWMEVIAGILIMGLTLSYWVDLRLIDQGRGWVLWVAAIIIANDTAAFFTGRKFGKTKLAPAISPNKTWEGSIGGLLAGVILAIIIYLLFSCLPVYLQLAINISWWQCVVYAIILGVAAQLGDLFESLLKRNFGVKDSSRLLPGHGGLLDRIDSFLFTGITAWYLIIFLI